MLFFGLTDLYNNTKVKKTKLKSESKFFSGHTQLCTSTREEKLAFGDNIYGACCAPC